LSPEGRARGHELFRRVCTHVAAAHDCSAEVEVEPGYPPTINDPRAVNLVREIAGGDFQELPASNMGGEDFSYVLEKVPGAMAFLGVAPVGQDAAGRAPLHNPAMMIDETVLPKGVAMHCAFASRFLERGWE
jgi:hippurate hydrolase